METKYISQYYKRSIEGRKSIKYEEIKEFGYLIKEGYSPRIDYLKTIDKIIEKG